MRRTVHHSSIAPCTTAQSPSPSVGVRNRQRQSRAAVAWGHVLPEMTVVQRSPNSHTLKTRAFPFVARLRREEPFTSADDAEWKAEAVRVGGGPDCWYSWARWRQDYDCKLIGFAIQTQASASVSHLQNCSLVQPLSGCQFVSYNTALDDQLGEATHHCQRRMLTQFQGNRQFSRCSCRRQSPRLPQIGGPQLGVSSERITGAS